MTFAAVQIVAAVAVACWVSGRQYWLLTGFLSLLLIDVYGNALQKRFGGVHPFVTDLLFGVFIAAPLTLGDYAAGGSIDANVLLFTGSFAFQGCLLNLIGGNLKDLRHDQQVGARTAAGQLGATQEETGGFATVSPAYLGYASLIFIAALAMLTATNVRVFANPAPGTAVHAARILAVASLLSLLAATAGFARCFRDREAVHSSAIARFVLWPLVTATFAAAGALATRWEILAVFVITYAWSFPIRLAIAKLDRPLLTA